MLRPGGALAADGPHATVAQDAWFVAGQPTAARRRLHNELLAEHRERFAAARPERSAVVLAGPPGAGKSSVLRQVLGEDLANYAVVDADDFKRGLLERAIADGSYETVIKPAEVRDLEAAGERFAPLEMASLVHEESSRLAKSARASVIDEGLNVVLDTVLSGQGSALELGQHLEGAGYSVRVVDVETTYEISAARVEQRWREVMREFMADERATGLGGRWVPSEYTHALFPPELGGASVCEGVARTLAELCVAVHRHEVHRVLDPAAAPALESAKERARAGGPLIDAAAARAAREAAVGRVEPRVMMRPERRETHRGDSGLGR
jgi:predicted ABC-type ATPase